MCLGGKAAVWKRAEGNLRTIRNGVFKDPPMKCRLLNTEAELIAAREFAEVFFEKIIKCFRAKGRTET